jgi:hypothetical protein
MATLKPELKAILDEFGINPGDSKQVWDCHGTLVLYHKAYEIIAAKRKIAFDPPTVIRAERNDAVVLVTGRMGDRVEWSIGEACIDQNYKVRGNQAAYPWAMAEKRAKDRVIAKLVGLAAYVYSEDEADEFKEGKPANGNGHDGSKPAPLPWHLTPEGIAEFEREIERKLKTVKELDALDMLWRNEAKAKLGEIGPVDKPAQHRIVAHFSQKKAELLAASPPKANGRAETNPMQA